MENQDEITLLKARVKELEIAEASLKCSCGSLYRQILDFPMPVFRQGERWYLVFAIDAQFPAGIIGRIFIPNI